MHIHSQSLGDKIASARQGKTDLWGNGEAFAWGDWVSIGHYT